MENPSHDKEKCFDEKRCLAETKHTLRYFIELTGIYGIDRDFDYKKYACVSFKRKGEIKVIIRDTPLLINLIVNIDLQLNTITNEEVKKKKNCGRGHLGRDLLKSQVAYAKEDKYEYIKIHAYGNYKKPDWNGYFVWAKYGFIMTDKKKYREILKEGMDKNIGIPNLNIELHDLVKDEKLLKWWIKKGADWQGKFLLKDNSKSEQILNEAFLK